MMPQTPGWIWSGLTWLGMLAAFFIVLDVGLTEVIVWSGQP